MLVAAYGYLIWKMVTYKDYPALWQQLQAVEGKECMCLLGVLMLFPLNILLEAQKWRTLVRDIYPMSLAESQRQVYGGMVGAFVTPYRAGEYPARTLLMNQPDDWKKMVGLGVYGSMILTMVILGAGIVPMCLFFGGEQMNAIHSVGVAVGLMVLFVAMFPLLKRFCPYLFEMLSGKTWAVVGWSLLRYLVFSLQMYLMLGAVGVDLPISEAVVALPTYYFLITLTPNMPAADAGIKGSWSVFVFSRYTQVVPSLAIAAILLWLINSVFPMLVGTFNNMRKL